MDYKWKWISIGTIGSLFALSHIGMIGMLANRESQFPKLNLPTGEYTSYSVRAGKDGYAINYRANDPLIMGVRKDINKPGGFLGLGKSTIKVEEQYTMDGARHHGGPVSTRSAWLDTAGGETPGKSGVSDKTIACIKAEGGGENTGRIVGGGIGAAAGGSLASVPYVGWVLAGAATMIGMDQGADIGGSMARSINDCDPDFQDNIEDIK
tara:strand:- start:264 stop:890 length:627 start_codon:yes stop_codon:yes gene_type:complete